MIPEIEYLRPRTEKEALSILFEKKEEAKILSGGTDIIPSLYKGSNRSFKVKTLIDIKSLNNIDSIEHEKDYLVIGAGCTFSQLAAHPLLSERYPLLTPAASTVGSLQIRNQATVVGNLVNNAPCADSVPPLLVYNAGLEIKSKSNTRKIGLGHFLTKPYTDQLKPEELVTRIILPDPPMNTKNHFYKLGRRGGVPTKRVTLAVLLGMGKGSIEKIRIAGGAVTPIGKRFYELENFIRGKPADMITLEKAARQLGEDILKNTGLLYSNPYKLPLVQKACLQILVDLCRMENWSDEC